MFSRSTQALGLVNKCYVGYNIYSAYFFSLVPYLSVVVSAATRGLSQVRNHDRT